MKLLTALSAMLGLTVLTSATAASPVDATPRVVGETKAAPPTSTGSFVSDFEDAHLDTGITVPPPGHFCTECDAWENDCKSRCGQGRACKDFCKCERAKRKPCRYTGCQGKKPDNCANKPRSMVERKAIENGLPGYWKSFGFGV